MGLLVKVLLGVIVGLIFTAVLVLAVLYFRNPQKQAPKDVTSKSTQSSISQNWKTQGVAVAGNFADADVVKLADGTYRLYYSIEPEVPGNQLEMYSAKSSDGKTWQQEEGIRHTLSTFPDVIPLPDNTWKMYFQNAGVIKSAISQDGLSWTDEADTRVDTQNSLGLTLDNVGASTTIQLDDQSYIMVYRGTILEQYRSDTPNKNTQLLLFATSSDGLTWEKKGLAIDTRNKSLLGLADGPDWVKWSDGALRLYFWSYQGVYYSVYKNGTFLEPKLAWATSSDSKVKFPPNPPGDPTLIKIGKTWFMYYGVHTKGISYATLEE